MSDPLTVLGQSLGDDKSQSDQLDVDAYLAEKVGDGKQFATAEDALREVVKGKLHADNFIETLKIEVEGERRDKKELEERLADSKKIDDLLNAINDEGSGGDDGVDTTSQNDSAQIDVTQLTTIVKNVLQAEKDADASATVEADKASNRDKAFELLAKPVTEGGFGSMENAKLAVRNYVGNDSGKAEIIDRIGSHTPDAVAEFLKIQLKNEDKLDGIGDSSITTPENNSQYAGMLTWAKCKEIKKSDPKYYRSPKFQTQIHKAAAANPHFWD
jgi:hypothetical protein